MDLIAFIAAYHEACDWEDGEFVDTKAYYEPNHSWDIDDDEDGWEELL